MIKKAKKTRNDQSEPLDGNLMKKHILFYEWKQPSVFLEFSKIFILKKGGFPFMPPAFRWRLNSQRPF